LQERLDGMNKQPNILLLFPDSHRGDWMPYDEAICRAMGVEALPLRMPHIRSMMEEGVTFTRAVSPAPLCAPARACLAAGVRYDRCGTSSNEDNFPLDKRTFYSVLKENGYKVGGVGKLDLHKPTQWWGLDGWLDDLATLGFTDAIDNAGKIDAVNSGKESPKDPYMKYLYDQGLAESHINDMAGRKGHGTDPTPLPEEAYCDNWLTHNGVQMLREFPQEAPWFLMVNFTGPHGPWDITQRMKAAWEDVELPPPNKGMRETADNVMRIRQNYAAMLENIDRNIGLLLEEVDRRGERNNTIVIYSSDHGEMLGDFNRFGKCVPYQGSVHIPLVISGPGISKGTVSDALVELQDLAATITEYAGASMKEAADSISLKPVLESKAVNHRDYQVSALDKDGKHTKHGWKMISDGHYKLNVIEESDLQLFDLKNDPWENENIAADNEEIILAMLNVTTETKGSGQKGQQSIR
jgi:arylsulfatase